MVDVTVLVGLVLFEDAAGVIVPLDGFQQLGVVTDGFGLDPDAGSQDCLLAQKTPRRRLGRKPYSSRATWQSW